MTEYFPDKWTIVEIKTPKETLYKVLASWYGGWAGSNSWKMSSGINKITEKDDTYEFDNYSGSMYSCHKETYGSSMYTMSVYNDYEKQITEANNGVSIRMLDEAEAKGLKIESNLS